MMGNDSSRDDISSSGDRQVKRTTTGKGKGARRTGRPTEVRQQPSWPAAGPRFTYHPTAPKAERAEPPLTLTNADFARIGAQSVAKKIARHRYDLDWETRTGKTLANVLVALSKKEHAKVIEDAKAIVMHLRPVAKQ